MRRGLKFFWVNLLGSEFFKELLLGTENKHAKFL